MAWGKKRPGPMACPHCRGVGRRHVREWTMGKGYVDKGRLCRTCNGVGRLPEGPLA
ncbi:hypothetical protein AB0K05_13005 [Nonomuraea sp. NPDC049486]|uniref:hypothetical protein n=1 Tax=Nonomuraea sp. NPDC049486 TaxID=3155773 RepID=UPI003437741B